MASDASAETVTMAIEEVDWLIKDFHDLIIGPKGSGLKALKEQTGAQVYFEDKRCMISGKEDELEKAKSFIAEKVEKQERWLSKTGELVSKSCVPVSLNWMKDDKWDDVPMPSRYFSQVIGKNLRTKFGVNIRLRKYEKKSQIVMQGQPTAKEYFLAFIEEFMKQKKEEELSENIDVIMEGIPRECLGPVIGKGGSMKKHLQAKHNVKITIKDEKIFLKGSEECCNAAKAAIDLIIKKYATNIPGRNQKSKSNRKIYFVGLEEKDEVKFKLTLSKRCIAAKHSEISWYPKVGSTLEKSYANILGLKVGLEDTLKKVKNVCELNAMAFCAITLHIGVMHYQCEPGSYKISDLQKSKFRKSIIYEKLPRDWLNLEQLNQLPIVNDYFRIDMKIVTPDHCSLRYKVFAKIIKSEVVFIDVEEAGVVSEEMVDIKVGPGYFCHPERHLVKNDIIDPDSNFTTRLNFDLIKPEKDNDEIVKKHAYILQDFLTSIVFQAGECNVNVILPDIVQGYKIEYTRCCERKHFKFANGNILRISNEKALNPKGGIKIVERDVFIKNLDLDKILASKKWELDKVIDVLEKQLKFFDTILNYLM